MYWLYPQKKYAETLFMAYDAKEARHFCPPGQNWGALTAEECDGLISLSKLANSVRLPNAKNGVVPDYHQADLWSINYTEETKWLWERVVKNLTAVNENYFGFEVYGIIEPLQLLCYDATKSEKGEGDRHELHIDNAHPFSCRKISFSLELSDPDTYQGGEFNVYASETTMDFPNSRGTMIMFPSFFLNEVKPIIKGKRWALVGWISGPQFR